MTLFNLLYLFGMEAEAIVYEGQWATCRSQFFPFHFVDPRNWTQVLMLGSNQLYPLGYITDHLLRFIN